MVPRRKDEGTPHRLAIKRNAQRRYRERHPEKIRSDKRVRRAQKKGVTVGEGVAEYEALLMHDPCAYCGAAAEHVDHIDALATGGIHSVENLTASCSSCNLRKHIKPLLMFLLKG